MHLERNKVSYIVTGILSFACGGMHAVATFVQVFS